MRSVTKKILVSSGLCIALGGASYFVAQKAPSVWDAIKKDFADKRIQEQIAQEEYGAHINQLPLKGENPVFGAYVDFLAEKGSLTRRTIVSHVLDGNTGFTVIATPNVRDAYSPCSVVIIPTAFGDGSNKSWVQVGNTSELHNPDTDKLVDEISAQTKKINDANFRDNSYENKRNTALDSTNSVMKLLKVVESAPK